jgi:outer membrane usher protein
LSAVAPARAIDIPDTVLPQDIVGVPSTQTLYLEIVINGISRGGVTPLVHEPDGSWSAEPDALEAAGLIPASAARRSDGRIDLNRLPGVSFVYDEPSQSLLVSAEPAAKSTLVLRATPRPVATSQPVDAQTGALLNYSVAFNPGYAAEAGEFTFGPVAAAFEARAYSPFGVLSSQFTLSSRDPTHIYRQNTNWRYAQPEGGWRVAAGDFTTGALDWTRPTRLGGLQVQNDFALQADVVTFPVPGMSGSAALPSTAEVYVNGIKRYSADVEQGPFVIEDLPLTSGSGTASLVVRDATGQEVTIERPFYVARELLRPGLLDYSFEVGYARIGMATDADRYDPTPMASASMRFGLTDWLTIEGHAEGGEGLINAGVGLTTSLLDRGVAQLAVTGSQTDEGQGYQAFGAIGFDFFGLPIRAKAQGTVGPYHDIGSFTYRNEDDGLSGSAPEYLAQISTSLPTPVDRLRLNLSYTELLTQENEHKRLVGLSTSQQLWGGSLSASASYDLIDKDYRVQLGYSWGIGEDMRASTSATSGKSGVNTQSRVASPSPDTLGDVGWSVGYATGDQSRLSATLDADLPALTTKANVSYNGESLSGSAQLSGAVVVNEAGILLANPIDDAFAVVDAGYAGVPVLVENRPIGVTGADGKLVVTGLRGFEANRVGIDSKSLPLDAVVLSTRQDIRPADGSGVVVSFGTSGDGSALVTFRDADGAFLPVGAVGQASKSIQPFMIGYDGQAYVIGLSKQNRVAIDVGDGRSCVAEFAFTAEAGEQVAIPDVTCRPE